MNKDIIGSKIEDWTGIKLNENREKFDQLLNDYSMEASKIENSGGEIAIEKQHSRGKMTARERIKYLLDDGAYFNEIGKILK